MDPLTVIMLSSFAVLAGRGAFYSIDYTVSGQIRTRLTNAKSMFHSVGGIWFGLIGAPLAAWFLLTFWIDPLLGINYSINIQTILNFTNPEPILIFLVLWLGIAFAFFGGNHIYSRHSGKMK